MTPDTIQQLLGNTEWLRALALQLLQDPDAADDVVQDTWVAALQRPPQIGGAAGLRAWLVRVTRNLAISRTRTESRRNRREAVAARSGVVPSTDQSIERIATQREIAGAVLALDAEDREVVVLRYFDDLPPREIARRLGVSSSAVRSRLSRALGKLRARLDRRFGGDDRSCARALAGVALGGVWVTKKVTMWCGVAALLVLVTIVATSLDTGATGSPASPPEPATGLVAAAEHDPAASPAEVERTELDAASVRQGETEVPTDGEKLIVLGRCVDPTGRPIAGATMTAVYVAGRPAAVSGPDGRVRLELSWPPKLTTGNNSWANVEITGPARTVVHRQERIHGAETVALGDVTLQPGGTVHGIVRDAAGHPAAGVWVRPVRGVIPGAPALEETRRVRGLFPGVGRFSMLETDASGAYRIEGVPVTGVSIVGRRRGCYCSYTRPFEVREGADVLAPELVLEGLRDENTIRGVVNDQRGQLLARASVQVFENHGPRNINAIARDRTGPDGRFELGVVSGTSFTLQIEDHRSRRSLVRDDVAAGTQGLEFRFPELRRLEIMAVGPSGDILRAPWVSVSTPKGFGLRFRSTLRDGTTRILDAPDQPFRVGVFVRGYRGRWFGPFAVGDAPKSIRAKLAKLPTISGRVLAAGRGVAGAAVHLHPLPRDTRLVRYMGGFYGRLAGSDRAISRVETDAEGRFELPVVVPRTSVVHVEAKGFARAESRVLTLGAESMRGVVLRLAPGGVIEGRVVVRQGVEVEGTLVAATNGDGHLLTQLVGSDGRYRFDSLTPGGWQVGRAQGEAREWLRQGRTWSEQRVTELPVQVEVVSGRTARFDLDFAGKLRVELRGSLMLDKAPAVGWRVSLFSGLGRTNGQTDRAGGFVLTAMKAGRWSLLLASPSRRNGQLTLFRAVDLKNGDNSETFACDTGSVELVDLPASVGASSYALRSKRGWTFRFDPDAGGRCAADGLPVGEVELRRREKGMQDSSVGEWTLVGGFAILAGDVTRYAYSKR